MTPDLTPIQTISIGVAIAVATLFMCAILLTVTYIHKVRNFLTRVGVLTPARHP